MKVCANFIFLTCILFSPHGMSLNVNAPEESRLFGYFANNGRIEENKDHTNLTVIWAGVWPDLALATDIITSELSVAARSGVTAVVSIDSFLFEWDRPISGPVGLDQCPFSLDPSAKENFAKLVAVLTEKRFLVADEPDKSVVAGFLIVDEPERCGLEDQGNFPNPALAAAVDVVLSNSVTSRFPTVITTSEKWMAAINGLKLVDWVGMYHYGADTWRYLSHFQLLESNLHDQQKTILMPQASKGGFMQRWGDYHDPHDVMSFFMRNEKRVGLIPFLWSHEETFGVRDIPDLRSAYVNYGKQIREKEVIQASLFCSINNVSWEIFECEARAGGGVPPYSFEWSGSASTSNKSIYTLQCPHPQSGDGYRVYESVSVKIADSRGRFSKAHTYIQCP